MDDGWKTKVAKLKLNRDSAKKIVGKKNAPEKGERLLHLVLKQFLGNVGTQTRLKME